jgi:ChrR Cupin-like domain
LGGDSVEHLDPGTLSWTRIHEGVFEKVLHRDESTRAYTRLVMFDPGSRIPDVLVHDFFEEFVVIEGSIIDETLNRTFTQGMFAFRRPGLRHGPFSCPSGCLAVEIRYYGRQPLGSG